MRMIWTRTHPLQKAIRPLLPKAAREGISRFFIGLEKVRLPFLPEQRERLMTYYRDDIRRLEDLIGRDLSVWLALRPAVPERAPADAAQTEPRTSSRDAAGC